MNIAKYNEEMNRAEKLEALGEIADANQVIHYANKDTKDEIISALHKYISQRSGIEWANYGGSRESFMGDYRQILKHGKDARALLSFVASRNLCTASDILKEGRNRLTFTERDGSISLEYCAGQYFALEYRGAVCQLLAAVAWHYFADGVTGENQGDQIRKKCKRQFGRGIASRWFN